MSYAILFLVVCELGIHVFEHILWAKILFIVSGGICFGILASKERKLNEKVEWLETELIKAREDLVRVQKKNNEVFESINKTFKAFIRK